MIFIDGSNLFHACKAFREGFKVDYEKLRDALTSGRKLIRAYFYGSINQFESKIMEKQIKFHDALRSKGFQVEVKRLKKRSEKPIEKGVDVALVTDMLSLGFKRVYDVAILVSGDSDFVRAIEKLKSEGIRVEVAMFKVATGPDLAKVADRYIALDDIANQIELK